MFQSREEAAALGQRRYRWIKPCKYGHLDERLVSTGNCVVCIRERQRRRLKEDTAYRELHKKCSRERARKILADPEERKRRRALERDAAQAPHRKAERKRVDAVRNARPEVIARRLRWADKTDEQKSADNARVSMRRASKLQATPHWLTAEHKAQIVKIYRRAPR